MLQSLRVRNLAIVEELAVEFGAGLNVITGETGAGKSVLVGALSLVLGDRADKSLLRAGAEQCSVEAGFHIGAPDTINALLDDLGLAPCADGCLVIRRQLSAAGTGKCFVNNSPATVQALGRVGDRLVDLHGPHDHQSLLSREFQLDLLDAFGHLGARRNAYHSAYQHWQQLQQQRAALDADGGDPTQQIAALSFQVKEIEAARLEELDEPALLREHAQTANAQRILELTGAIQRALAEDESSAFTSLAHTQKLLGELAGILPEADAWRQQAAALAIETQELARSVAAFAQKVDADPERLQALDDRLARVHQLKRKYGPTVADVLGALQQARERLDFLSTRGERAAQLDAEIRAAAAQVQQLGRDLTGQRRAAAKKLAAAVTRELRDLGFPHGAFDVTLTAAAAPGPTGLDEIEFAFAPNVGEPARSLRQIASSGEMSRVMLACKVVLAAHDQIPVLVFDEIDANVGGEMGRAIGEKLQAVAAGHQVLCITHLPQVAVQGAAHYVVTKTVRAERTTAAIQPVADEARADEIARMLGGRDLTSVTLQHARELLGQGGRPRPKKRM